MQAIEEILAEAPRLHFFAQVLVRGRDESEVDLDGLGPAQADDAFLFEHAQELDLDAGVSSPTSSRKRVPRSASSNFPCAGTARR
ncbi:MAG: hypothetical protein R3E12_07325 [Candidatus Eisenbacteria bacterium]